MSCLPTTSLTEIESKSVYFQSNYAEPVGERVARIITRHKPFDSDEHQSLTAGFGKVNLIRLAYDEQS